MKIIHNGYEYFIILFEEAAPGTEFINNAHCVLDQSVHTECTQRERPGLLYLKVDRRPEHEKFFGIPTYVQVDDPDHFSIYTMFTLQMKLL